MERATGLSTEDADLLISRELAQARISPITIPVGGEVRASLGGNIEAGGYVIRLRRAWVFWVATVAVMPNPPEDRMPHLPEPLAKALNDAGYKGAQSYYSGREPKLGSVARAGGFAGGQDSSELGRGVYSWHIDTQEGLNAFAAWIKENLR